MPTSAALSAIKILEGYHIPVSNYEKEFRGIDAIEWTQEHAEVPVLTMCAYLWFIYYVPRMLEDKDPFPLRQVWAVWNLLLSAFSIIGVTRTLPVLIHHLLENGFRYTTCTNPYDWYTDGPTGLWVALFIFSKIPELIDTVFLVLQKKEVIFLHWFHHATVLMYCWHAFHNAVACGLWFASMNFSVHSIMYFYYFAAINGGTVKKIVRKIAPLITALQLVQMIVGCTVTVAAGHRHWNFGKEACHVDAANYKLGLAMYFSYFCLFAVLFHNLYCKESKHTKRSQPKETETETESSQLASFQDTTEMSVCGVDTKRGDAAGFFHTTSGTNLRSLPAAKKTN